MFLACLHCLRFECTRASAASCLIIFKLLHTLLFSMMSPNLRETHLYRDLWLKQQSIFNILFKIIFNRFFSYLLLIILQKTLILLLFQVFHVSLILLQIVYNLKIFVLELNKKRNFNDVLWFGFNMNCPELISISIIL